MTETPADRPAGPDAGAGPTGTATADPLPPPVVRLVRPREGRVLRGVCAGLGRATGTDPVLWRVLVVVLAVLGGSGLVLYLAGWLLVPEEGRAETELQRLARGQGAGSGAVLAAVVLAVLLWLAVAEEGRALLVLLVVAGLVALVVRTGRDAAPPGSPLPPSGAAAWDAPPAWVGPPPVAPPAAPSPRGSLGRLTVSAAAVAAGGLLLARALGADGITGQAVLATALLVTGAGLLVGTRWGRSRGLVALAAVLALATAAAGASDGRLSAGTGDRTWAVDGSVEHRLGAGSAVLDLRPLAGTDRRDLTVDARVGAGELLVLVPEDLRVELDAGVGLGELRLDGPGLEERRETGNGLEHRATLGPSGPRNVRIEARVGFGEMEVRRVAAG